MRERLGGNGALAEAAFAGTTTAFGASGVVRGTTVFTGKTGLSYALAPMKLIYVAYDAAAMRSTAACGSRSEAVGRPGVAGPPHAQLRAYRHSL